MNDFRVFLLSFTGSFLKDLNRKIRAGNIFAIKNTLMAAFNTFVNFQ